MKALFPRKHPSFRPQGGTSKELLGQRYFGQENKNILQIKPGKMF
jgi:hypothetical protein